MKSTKETQDLKEELQRKEQIKEAAKKRTEKQEELEVRKRIRARIEADKENRRRKAEEAKAVRERRTIAAPAVAAPAPASAAPKPSTSHNEARLRFQLPSGNAQKTFEADATLFEVAQAIETEHGITVTKFEMTFPRKVFEGSTDFSKTLREAGLVPSAVLRVH